MLTLLQKDARKGKLTASRVAVLMRGDAVGILRLWEEMTGQVEEEVLDHVWPVRLGEATEALNLEWFERKNGIVTRRGEVVVDRYLPWAAATIDGYCDDIPCIIECKHVGGREPMETIIERYQPQMQWQMEVCGVSLCALSVIMGANEPVVEFVDRDAVYGKEMLNRGSQFMGFVTRRVPPVEMPPVPPPVDATKIIDMTGNNRWAVFAIQWMQTRLAKEQNVEAEKVLKTMVQDDAKKVFGNGVRITRDRAGRLSLREDK